MPRTVAGMHGMQAGVHPSPPTRLGPYRLLHVVGGGGMGVVHLGLDPDGRAVAIKVLRPHVAAEATARRRLAREVETLRRVRSPRVAEVLDADPDAEQPYVVTQYVPAPPLDTRVEADGPLRGLALARLGLGLGDALSAIHAAGVVHRDLKPGNVLVLDGEPVVIDFGIAQIADDVRLTSTGLVMGTPGYLSPEVLDGGAVTVSADWWGWAATVAFAATGRPPFGTGPTEAVLSRVRRGVADLDGAPEPLAGVLAGSLHPDPARRPTPRTLREAVQALGAAAAGAPAGTATPRAPTAPLRSTEPTWAPAAPTTRVPTATTATTAVPVDPWRGRPPRTSAPPAEPTVPTAIDLRGDQHPWPPQTGPHPLPEPYPQPGTHPSGPHDPGGYHDASAAPPVDGAPARRSGTLAVGALALMASAVVAPVAITIAAGLMSVLARAVDRSASAAARRRFERGPRRTDPALTALGLPGHLLSATLATAPAMLLPLAVGLSAAFLVAWAVTAPPGWAPGLSLPLFAGAASAVLTGWWGPGGSSLRSGARRTVRALAPGEHGARIAVAALLVVAVAAVLVVMGSGGQPDWSPLPPSWVPELTPAGAPQPQVLSG